MNTVAAPVRHRDNMSGSPQRMKLKQQQEAMNNYIQSTHLKDLFKVLLKQVVIHQPDDPFEYMYKQISQMKQEMNDNQIDLRSTTFLTTQFPPTEGTN